MQTKPGYKTLYLAASESSADGS